MHRQKIYKKYKQQVQDWDGSMLMYKTPLLSLHLVLDLDLDSVLSIDWSTKEFLGLILVNEGTLNIQFDGNI